MFSAKLSARLRNQSGFTLIELLVVIGILAILMTITIIAINPAQQFQNSRNADRESDVTTILDGIYQYTATKGTLPASLSALPTGAVQLAGISYPVAVTSTSFSTPSLTLNVASGNLISGTVGTVTISGCSQAGDNGTWNLLSGTNTTVVVSDAGASATSATGCSITAWTGAANVCSDLVPTYFAALPMDSTGSTGTACTAPYKSGYTVAVSTGNRFTVAAPNAENGVTISVQR